MKIRVSNFLPHLKAAPVLLLFCITSANGSEKDHHKLPLFYIQNTVKEVTNSNTLEEKFSLINDLRESLQKHFTELEGSMPTQVRLDYLSVMEVFLPAIPTNEIFMQEDCDLYWQTYTNPDGIISATSESEKEIGKLLSSICPGLNN